MSEKDNAETHTTKPPETGSWFRRILRGKAGSEAAGDQGDASGQTPGSSERAIPIDPTPPVFGHGAFEEMLKGAGGISATGHADVEGTSQQRTPSHRRSRDIRAADASLGHPEEPWRH